MKFQFFTVKTDLVIKLDDLVIEPLSEAFGQNLETVNINATKSTEKKIESKQKTTGEPDKKMSSSLTQPDDLPNSQDVYMMKHPLIDNKILNIINKISGQEAIDDMETIVARDVEQGKCSSFKKIEVVNEKRSVNEPKYTPVSIEKGEKLA